MLQEHSERPRVIPTLGQLPEMAQKLPWPDLCGGSHYKVIVPREPPLHYFDGRVEPVERDVVMFRKVRVIGDNGKVHHRWVAECEVMI